MPAAVQNFEIIPLDTDPYLNNRISRNCAGRALNNIYIERSPAECTALDEITDSFFNTQNCI